MAYWYSTPADVSPEFGSWSDRIKWCEQNCKEHWRYKGTGSFAFASEKDYTLFLLRWS